jgi:transforming growth factor-beta-induced protein
MKFNKFLLTLSVAAAAFLTACSDDTEDSNSMPEPASNTIVDVAVNNDFNTLVSALQRVNLDATLEGEGPFTVFAPTDQAFQDLLDELKIQSLDEVSDADLTEILLNHVVSGKVMSTDLSTGYVSTLASGPGETNINAYIDLTDGVMINGRAKVTNPNIEASNGVVHVIDKVLLVPNAVDAAVANPNLSILVAALTREDLDFDFVTTLSGDGPFTIFAPTNDAFVALLESNMNWNELADIPAATLEAVLKYHVIAGANVTSADITDGQMPETFEGTTVTLNKMGSDVTVTDANDNTANVALPDVQTGNAVIHVIDKVIVP